MNVLHCEARDMRSRNQEPVLVDVAQFIHCPEGVSCPAVVSLHSINEDSLNLSSAYPKTSAGSDFSGKAICIVGEWEASVLCLARDRIGKSYGDVIEDASQVSHGIADQDLDDLSGLMKRIKDNFDSPVPLIRLKPQGVEVCRQKGPDMGLYVCNVVACAI